MDILIIVIIALIIIIARKGITINNFKYIMLTEDKKIKNIALTIRETRLWVAFTATLILIIIILLVQGK